MPKTPYNIHAEWDDPYDHQRERRISARLKAKFRLSLSVDSGNGPGHLVGPGIVQNMSEGGVSVLTKHSLRPGQTVHIEVPTHFCPPDMCLPDRFEGEGDVIRVDDLGERKSLVGIRLGEAFSENMEFAVFVDYVRSVSKVMSSP